MGTKTEHDQYAVDLTKRFEEFTQWAIEHWPNKEFPLLSSDFEASRREISEILGPKLGEGSAIGPEIPGEKDPPQYLDVTPMPWP